MKKSIYVFSEVWQMDSGECGDYVKAFNKVEDALKWLKEAKSNAISEMCDFLNSDEIDYNDGDMAFSIWEAGEYCYNHIDMNVREVEVE